jgi:hypothetical protein
MPRLANKERLKMAIKTLAAITIVSIFAIASNSASAGTTAAQNRMNANYHGTCGQQVTHKHPGMTGAAFKAEYSKCQADTAAGKNYLTD